MAKIPEGLSNNPAALAAYMQEEMSFYKTIGKNIRSVRRSKGISTEDVAEKIGRWPGTINGWECGRRYIGIFDLHRVAAVLEVSLFDLLYGPEKGNQEAYLAGHRSGAAEALQALVEAAQSTLNVEKAA